MMGAGVWVRLRSLLPPWLLQLQTVMNHHHHGRRRRHLLPRRTRVVGLRYPLAPQWGIPRRNQTSGHARSE